MSLIAKLKRYFDTGVVTRGRSYYASGRVRRVRSDQVSFEAKVRGSYNYSVELLRDGSTLVARCDCPYYLDNLDLCKHIVAAVLSAEAAREPVVAGDVRSIDVIDDDLPQDHGWDDEDDDYEDEDDDYEDEDYDYEDDDYEDEWPDEAPQPVRARESSLRPTSRSTGPAKTAASRRAPGWRETLEPVRRALAPTSVGPQGWPDGRQMAYVVDHESSRSAGALVVDVFIRDRKKDGTWGELKAPNLSAAYVSQLPDAADRRVMSTLVGARPEYSSYAYYPSYVAASRYRVPAPLVADVLETACRAGRCFLRAPSVALGVLQLEWDDGEPWQFWVEVSRTRRTVGYTMTGALRRPGARRPLAEPLLALDGVVVDRDRAARMEAEGGIALVDALRRAGELRVPDDEVDLLLGELLELPSAPRLDLPAALRVAEVAVPPTPRVVVKAPDRGVRDRLALALSFDYDGSVVGEGRPGRGVFDGGARRLLLRDAAAESAAAERLGQFGFKPWRDASGVRREIPTNKLPKLVRDLLAEGWIVEADGKLYRHAGDIRIEVASGVDWFDLKGTVEYGETSVALPALLAAAKRGEKTVRLDDGTLGLLPEDWLRKYGLLASLGHAEGDALRFRRSQAGLLDALLSSQPEVRVDRAFARARDELKRFDGVEPVSEPAGFRGELRPYQREGLGWLAFLERFGFGGCLADDMGLGKSVQTLAMLEARRARRARARSKGPRASLVVVPKSLVFNWKLEAAKFTPKLVVLDHTGTGRAKAAEAFEEADLVLTTYGTLRRDAALFASAEFGCVVLDEAQAIKNASTESAKAARLLRGERRLALSGTPVENHLGELWSLFEFLNPGFLGASSAFGLFGAGGKTAEPETRELLARALRPFILRRTKEQVAKDLPTKSEQTLYCDLEPGERRLYDQLRRHYRESLLGRVETFGMARAKIHVLEALLRLRQAACHPGLIDKKRTKEASAKLDVLLDRLREVLDEGHKALVFSQFTSMLAIVRDRLDRDGVDYEYLDGKTRDRAARVERFQTDPACRLFLISLKAGGLGLNLTEAEYIFLLDPWWNPAVEAQAIDRAHRIGQTRAVFAYRVIARDTVEEKVLELQRTKRELADAILGGSGLIRDLTSDDLRLLLS